MAINGEILSMRIGLYNGWRAASDTRLEDLYEGCLRDGVPIKYVAPQRAVFIRGVADLLMLMKI